MRKLLLILVLSFPLFAQYQQTLYQTVFTNNSSATIVSSPVNSIGQISHFFTVAFSDAPTKTCSTVGLANNTDTAARIQGSYDNVTYFNIPNTLVTFSTSVTAPLRVIYTYYAIGVFPYVRFRYADWDNVNCIASSLQYSGSLYPFTPLQGVGFPILPTSQFTSGATKAAGTYTISLAAQPFSRQIFYGGVITAGGAAATVTINIRGNGGAPSTTNVYTLVIPANTSVLINPSGNAIAYAPIGGYIELITDQTITYTFVFSLG